MSLTCKGTMRSVFLIAYVLSVALPRPAHTAEAIPDEVKRTCPQCFQEYVRYSYEVTLPIGMRKALDNYDSSFTIFKMADFAEEIRLHLGPGASNKSCYSAVFEDFNGDGRYDAALFGRTKKAKEDILLVILSEKNAGYKVIEINRFGPTIPQTMSISLSSPGKLTESCGGKSIEIKNYGIAISIGFGVSVVYWDDIKQKFEGITTGGC